MLNLERLCGSQAQDHVILSISGFFSQDQDLGEHWKGLVNYLRFDCPEMFDPEVYSVSWQATTFTDMGGKSKKVAKEVAQKGKEAF